MLFLCMEKIDLIGFAGIIIGFIGFVAFGKKQRQFLFIIAVLVLLCYSLIKPIFPFAFLMIVALGYLIFELIKFAKSKSSIKLLEVEYDNNYIVEFVKNYKRDIYNYFPFYQAHESHKCFLVMRDMNLAGILIVSINKEILTIEVDYTKPSYRDTEIGNYIYKHNPGYFKKMGISKLIAKSFHKGHSRFLKKMGFEQVYFDNQLAFVKNLD